MSEGTKGVAAMGLACIVWGLSPLYYGLLRHVPPLELLAHRTVWSLILFGLLVALQGRGAAARRLVAAHPLRIAVAAGMITTNWFLFIYSVQARHVVESSLGYYIFPLVAVALGALVFGERLGRLRALAVAIAAAGVAALGFGLGVAPWIALAIATSFGLYGVIKKGLDAGPVVSVTAEVAMLSPVAVLWLGLVHAGVVGTGSGSAWFGRDLATSLLLVASGALTAGPLILFSYASRRMSLAALGLTQYLNPTLQFLCAVVVFGEVFTPWHAAAFGLIWVALALYSASALAQEKAARRTASRPSTSATVPK